MKITSARNLVIELSKGAVSLSQVGKNLSRIVALWEKRKEISIVNGQVYLAK